MAKTLLNVLKQLNPKEMIYLGCNRGSNWIIIDRAENLIKNIDNLNDNLYNDAVRKRNNYNAIIYRSPFTILDLRKELEEHKLIISKMVNKDVDDKDVNAIENKILSTERSFASAVKCRDNLNTIIEKWKPIKNREVFDIYDVDSDIKGKAIKFDGRIDGAFWFDSEQKDKKVA